MFQKTGRWLMLAGALWGANASAQQPTVVGRAPAFVRGVATSRGVPLAGVNVFDMQTLEGTLTGEDGHFTIVISDSTRTTLHIVAKAVGYSAVDTTLVFSGFASIDSLIINLKPLGTLIPITVLAGRYTASAARTTTLTPAEVASTPGSNADISGAIKTLPGVQNADEGSGIFVRGGDFTETRMFVDGAPLFSAYQFEAPTGSVAGTINPFLTSAITFASGGFGAEWGNALSGIVDLRTQGRATRTFANVNASILGATVGGGLALPHGLGVTATAGVTDLRAMLALNGNPRAYAPAPHGQIASGLLGWEYSRTGIVKVFALLQKNAFGVPVPEPAFNSNFTSNRNSDIVVASWTDSIAKWRPFLGLSTSGLSREEEKGSYHQRSDMRSVQIRMNSAIVFSERAQMNLGAELERLSSRFNVQLPQDQYNAGPNAPTVTSRSDLASNRSAIFASIDARPTSSTELIAGVRSSQSASAVKRTIDPRVSLAWVPRTLLTLTASWGTYHQVADPAFFDRLNGENMKLPELTASMSIAGAQYGEGHNQVRVEAWTKRYSELVALTRTYTTVSGLYGRARGADLFARAHAPLGSTFRLTYSLSNSRRQDPNTRQNAQAAFDVTSSVTAILQKEWKSGWSSGIAVKRATGRPFTEVIGATFDATHDVYVPAYDAPNTLRLPPFNRTDATVSKQLPFGADRFGVVYAGINNVFNQVNTFSYTWSRDYSTRLPVRSAVSRTFFIGGNLVLLAAR